MISDFILVPLRGDRVMQAFPLVREVAPDITLEGWREFALAILRSGRRGRPREGLVAACSGNDYLRGLFAYRVAPHLRCGLTFHVDCLVVSSLFQPTAVAEALIAGAEAQARESGCAAVHAVPLGDVPWLRELLAARGYQSGESCLCRRLNGADGAHHRGSRTPPSPGT